MKKSINSLLIISLIVSSLTVNAQIGNLKKGISKVKDKTSTEETPAKTSGTKAVSTENFTDLEKEKMEWSSTFERLQKKWDQLPYTEYEAKKKDYSEFYVKFSSAYKTKNKKDHSDAYTQKLITEVDGYYSDKVPASQMEVIKNTASKSFDEKSWSVYPTDRVNDIETAQKQVNTARAYLKQPDPELEAYEKTLADQKAKIIKYVSEGGLEKRDAEIEKRLVEKRTLHQAGMSDASVNSTVNSKIDKNKYGSPLKVVITSQNWEFERNQYGQPKLKFVKVDIATKKADGKCYYVKGSVAQKHEGGGVYGEKYLNIYYTEGEMNCNNVK
ncbi:MAG: hypothetical protein K0B10_08600 [Vicingaceae bacterium]|nr:hypothetical protein [Vicingaceae bacterium]